MSIGRIYLGHFWVEENLINFISLYPKGLCIILLKRTEEVKENNTKINLGILIINRYFGSKENIYYSNNISKLSIYGLKS